MSDALQLLIQTSRKRAVASLNTDGDKQFAAPSFGEILPIEASRVTPIVSPTGQRVFDPQSWAGWTDVKAAIGNGPIPPVAGTWYMLSGIPLTSGTVTNAKRFKIIDFNAGDNFTNIGAGSNATGVVFTSTGTTPTVWSNGSELQEITANLVYNADTAAVSTALNNTAWITAGGGVTVSIPETASSLYFFVTWVTAGSRAQMQGFADNLAPLSIVEPGTLITGTSSVQEIQTIRVLQNDATFVVLSGSSDPADVDVDEVTVGGGGFNAKYRFTLAPAPYDGAFSVVVRGIESGMIAYNTSAADFTTALENISKTSGLLISGAKYTIVSFETGDDFANLSGTNVTGNVFTASGTTPTVWTNGSVLSPVASGNVSVTKEADNQYLAVFQAALANTDLGTITADASALQVIDYRTGTMNLDTPGVQLLLGTALSVPTFFAITGVPPGESFPQELLRLGITLNAAIIDPAATTPTPFYIYFTSTQSDARYLRQDASSAVASGNTMSVSIGATLDVDGAFNGTPTGGTLDLSDVDVTLGSVQLSVLSADSSNITTNVTPSPVSGLSFSLGANETWHFELGAWLVGASATPGFSWTMNGPQSASLVMYFDEKSDLAAAVGRTARSALNSVGAAASVDNELVYLYGTITNGATPQSISFYLSQQTSSADAIKVKAGSYIQATMA